MRQHSRNVLIGALVAGITLSACSSTERMATPADDMVLTDPDSSLTGASLRGTRVCVINQRTNRDGKPALIQVKFSKADRVSQEVPYVPPGGQFCAEGAFDSGFAANDVEGVIYTMYDDTPTTKLWARNRRVGDPELEIQVGTEVCDTTIASVVRILDDKINRFTLRRLPDSPSFKEFTVTISDGESRSSCYGAGPY